MINPLEFLLEKMELSLKENDLNSYYNYLTELTTDFLPCFCPLKSKGIEYWQAQITSLKKNSDFANEKDKENSSFFELIIGFLSLLTEEHKLAFDYLSVAVEKTFPNDMALLLRSHCNSEINTNRMQDATLATIQVPSAMSYYLIGSRHFDLNQFTQAKFFLNKSLNLNKYSRCTYLKLAKCFGEDKAPDYIQALYNLEIVLSQNPKDKVAFFLKSFYLNKACHYEKAIEFINKGIQLIPDFYSLYTQLAFANHKIKDYNSALFYYNKYLEKYPNDQNIIHNINLINKIKGSIKEDLTPIGLKSFTRKDSVSDSNFFLFYYIPQSNDLLSNYLIRFKKNEQIIVRALANCVAHHLNDLISQGLKIDMILRALGSEEILAQEGTPLDLFAKIIAKETGLKYERKLLSKIKRTRKFSKYLSTSSERFTEIQDAYQISKLYLFLLSKRNNGTNSFLIIDDVTTSGATLETIGRKLKSMQPTCKLYFLTIAKTNRGLASNELPIIKLITSYIEKEQTDELPF